MSALEKYLAIAAKNLRYNFLPYLALGLAILLITPVLFGVNDLNAQEAAVPLELLVALLGIILYSPVFLPEQNSEIREAVEAKYTSYLSVCILRTVISLAASCLFIILFVLLMKANGCEVMFLKHAFGTFAESLFLGSMLLLAYGISGNIAVGYMVPAVYYAFNFSGSAEGLGKLYLFSMTKGSFEEKYWLLGIGVLFIVLTFCIKAVVQKKR
jgi:membrane-associated HD superfamily phosphohydrolase